jgi:biotin carboxyl carrier protein
VVIKAPIAGSVHKIPVKVGDVINEGQIIMILEAMKMETEIKSAVKGTISAIAVSRGQRVSEGQELIYIK